MYRKASSRKIAFFLLVLMVLNAMPLFLGIVFAMDRVHAGIVISVTDQVGKAISGAAVEYRVEQVDDVLGVRTEILSEMKLTNQDGRIIVMEETEFIPNLELSAVISYEGFITDDTSISEMELAEKNQEFIVQLEKNLIRDEFQIIEKKNLIYTGKEQELLERIDGITDRDTIEYKINDKAWSRQLPVATEAGNYEVKVRIGRYKELIELEPQIVVIKKATQKMKFKNYVETEKTVIIDGIIPRQGIKYDFSAISYDETKELTGGAIKYKIDMEAGQESIAAMEEDTGQLTVFDAGKIRVKAILSSANPNYEGTEVEILLYVKQRAEYKGQYIRFEHSDINYIFGFHSNVSVQQVKNNLKRSSKVTYSISDTSLGLSCNATSGAVTVENYEQLIQKLEENNGAIKLAVKAELKSGGWLMRLLGLEIADEAEYFLRITYGDLPKDSYSLMGIQGENDWYISDVAVVPKKGYKIARTVDQNQFSESVLLNDTTHLSRKVYLLEENTSRIFRVIIPSDIKVDTLKPDSKAIKVYYSNPITEKRAQDKDYQFYQDKVKLTFQAVDTGSGVEYFRWKYYRENEAGLSNLKEDFGIVKAIQDRTDTTKYSAITYLPKEAIVQMRGEIRVTAKDYAGLHSEEKVEERKIIVIDTIKPTASVECTAKALSTRYNKVGNIHYYSDSAEAIVKVTESNFYPEDLELWLIENDSRRKVENAEWIRIGTSDTYQTKVLLQNEGTYQIKLSYKDRSDNEMAMYQSDTYVIDRTAPKILFQYLDHADKEKPQVAKITIIERNFNRADIRVKTIIKDRNEKELESKDLQNILRTAAWESKEDVHVVEIEKELTDGIYNLIFDYKDLAGNLAQQLVTEKFVVDRTPISLSEMEIQYSVPIYEMILSDITFGFYNPTVTITLSANDEISGVDHFVWSYVAQLDESTTHIKDYPDTMLHAIQDQVNKTAFSAVFTLPKDKADQLRGRISFLSVDKSGNRSDKKTDSNRIIVVDTVAPTMTVEYSSPIKKIDEKMYYNDSAWVKLQMTESNFYPEDVKVEIVKDGKTKKNAKIKWLNFSVDEHIGRFAIEATANHSMDGEYQITISYQDKSGNKMREYRSPIIVIDTTKPVIEVLYQNDRPRAVLSDWEANQRSYFDATQIATVTIKERNFDRNAVIFKISAKDVSGNPLAQEEMYIRSDWGHQSDEHTMTITYFGDANYTFSVEVEDLASNQAEKRKEDFFTVDTTAPSKLEISYSKGILEQILESVSFGYYNAKVTVVAKAEDNISGIHDFRYYYRAQSEKESEFQIKESEIRFLPLGAKAEATFQVPNSLNQFKDSIDFYVTDRAGNSSDRLQDKKIVVVDNISPQVAVQYNAPVQAIGNVSYYNSEVIATISVIEANFYPEDVKVLVTRDGKEIPAFVQWNIGTEGVHIGRLVLSEDGDYFIAISYIDRSQNKMANYVSGQITIDTYIKEASILINGIEADQKSFRDKVEVEISFEDKNFDRYEISVLRSNWNESRKDVTKEVVKQRIRLHSTGGRGTLEEFKKSFENDGIYTIFVWMKDKAGQEVTKKSTFSVNRFGSVYQYHEYLDSLIQNGGAYVNEITEDLIVMEYNASPLVQNSLKINISLDGKPLEDIVYSEKNISEESYNSWNRYEYRIAKSNFVREGIYKITISSKDEAGNYPENNNYKDREILFRIDKTAPEINSVVGLEEQVINATEVDVKYTLYDTIGLKSVIIYVSGQEVARVTDFQEEANQYAGSFSLKESPTEQTIRIVVEDMAGNITDTHTNEFSAKFDLNTTVTISTNVFVRWYANKRLFWGSIVGVLVSISGIGGYVFILKKRLMSI